MFKVGDLVRFSKRTQLAEFMTVLEVDHSPLFDHVLYKLSGAAGWWESANLMKYL